MLKIAAGAIGLLFALVAIAGLIFIYSGIYDIAATTAHSDFTHRVIRTVMEHSIKRQARDIQVPELDDPGKVHAGFKNFHAMCVTCHGAPGAESSEISKGLYPEAPNLAVAAKAWTPAELYVIIKHGIKMSGMPAWEPTHSGDEIWTMVAFLKVLPTMPTAEYQGAAAYLNSTAGEKNMQMHGNTH